MSRRTVLRLLAAAALGAGASRAAADSIRCAGGIVAGGDSRLALLGKCGPPALQASEPLVAAPLADASLAIERWTYDFGPDRFIQVVSLRGGRVIAVERGGYGHAASRPPEGAAGDRAAIPRALCAPEALRIGDVSLEVLAKCGDPAFRDLRPGRGGAEVWTYDFGRRALIRFVELEGGRVVRIRTGSYGYAD
jgi:hypothetical protein